jgi:DNA polymerase-3 subunit delta'
MGFEDVLGHQAVKERLGRMAFSGRLGSAYLFLGPAGVGRVRTALAWAQTLNCLQPQAGYPYACGTCRPCRAIAKRQFPDLFIMEPLEGKDLKIDQARELLRETRFKPYEGKKRVFIVDGADQLNDAAANALLKTLEEPPASLLMILIAEHEGQLLPTIKSRCQIIRFGSLPFDIVASELVKRGASETLSRWLAQESSGSLGEAEKGLTDQDATRKRRDDLFASLSSLHGDPVGSFKMAEKYKKAEDAVPVLRLLKAFYRDAVVFKAGKPDRVVNTDHLAIIQEEAESHSLPELVDRFQWVEDAERRMEDFNANKQLVLERLLQELSY